MHLKENCRCDLSGLSARSKEERAREDSNFKPSDPRRAMEVITRRKLRPSEAHQYRLGGVGALQMHSPANC
jgi:hypothetical protein